MLSTESVFGNVQQAPCVAKRASWEKFFGSACYTSQETLLGFSQTDNQNHFLDAQERNSRQMKQDAKGGKRSLPVDLARPKRPGVPAFPPSPNDRKECF